MEIRGGLSSKFYYVLGERNESIKFTQGKNLPVFSNIVYTLGMLEYISKATRHRKRKDHNRSGCSRTDNPLFSG